MIKTKRSPKNELELTPRDEIETVIHHFFHYLLNVIASQKVFLTVLYKNKTKFNQK